MAWLDEAKTKLSYLKSLHATRNSEFLTRDHLYTLDHDAAFNWPAPTEAADVRVISSRPVRLVKHVKGLFLSHTPRIIASPLKVTKANQRLSGSVERFLLGTMQANEERFGSVLARGIEMAGVRGWGSWFLGWDVDREEDEGEDLGCPIIWRNVDPEYLYYERGGVRERFASVMYAIERRRADVEREWGKKIDTGTTGAAAKVSPHDSSQDTVEYVDYWWWERVGRKWQVHNAIWAGNTVLKKRTAMPHYTRLPYLTWFTQPAPFSEPEWWGTGWLWDMRESLKTWERAANRQMRRLTFAADNQYILEARDQNATPIAEGYDLKISPGTIVSAPMGWVVKPLVTLGPSNEAERMLSLAEQEMDAILPQMAQGNLPGGDTGMSGVTFHGVTEAATTWLAPDTESLVQVLRNTCELILDLCQGYAEGKAVSVVAKIPSARVPTVERASLKGSEMAGFRVDVSIDTDTAADDMRLMQIGMQLAQMEPARCPFDLRTIQEKFFKVEDPEGIMDAKLVEFIEQRPEMIEYTATIAAERYGLPRPNPPQPPSPPPGQGGMMPPGMMPPPPQSAMGPGGPVVMPGQMAMQPGGMPGAGPGFGPAGGPPMPSNALVSPQEMMGSPAPMAVPPGLPLPPGMMPQ